MSGGKLILKVLQSQLVFQNSGTKFDTGGDVNSKEIRLNYINGSGQTCNANDILYTEGTIGNMDFFEIKALNNHTFVGSNYISVIISVQLNVAGGVLVPFNCVILNSIPFIYTVEGS